MNIKELVIKLRIEEDNGGSEKKMFNPDIAKANVIETGESSTMNRKNLGHLAEGLN